MENELTRTWATLDSGPWVTLEEAENAIGNAAGSPDWNRADRRALAALMISARMIVSSPEGFVRNPDWRPMTLDERLAAQNAEAHRAHQEELAKAEERVEQERQRRAAEHLERTYAEIYPAVARVLVAHELISQEQADALAPMPGAALTVPPVGAVVFP